MSELVRVISSADSQIRNRSVDEFCRGASTAQLLCECAALDQFRRTSNSLYERVRAQLFLYDIYRFHLPGRSEIQSGGLVPFAATTHLLQRRHDEALEILHRTARVAGLNRALSSGLAAAYRGLAFKTLADQVRRSVRAVRGNQWMSRIGHPDEYPLGVRPELLERSSPEAPYPILRELTPVRMDLTHSAWSDIFFLGMDFPEGARVLNVSIDLSVKGTKPEAPKPPIEIYFRVIDEPLLRLTSIDLQAAADIVSFAELFDFGRDYLGLLKAAVIASGLVPPATEGAGQPLAVLLGRLVGEGRGVEIVSRVRDIPKGSRLAVSTNLLAGLISLCMRATGQSQSLTGPLGENDRRLVAARAILGEWLGGSGGGWQDSGGVWPGVKLIEGVEASEGDPEFGISRGRLLPQHQVLSRDEVPDQARKNLQDSLVLVHGGMAQDVGPILEMVTEKYLLRSEREWVARQQAIQILGEVRSALSAGDVRAVGAATEKNFFGPIQSIIPWASNFYTEALIERTRSEMGEDFWGFWMLGGMAGGGMGFMFNPRSKWQAQHRLQAIMLETKQRLQHAVPFAMDPVVYDFTINENGTTADLLTDEASLMPESYYALMLPKLLRSDAHTIPHTRRAELYRLSAATRGGGGYSKVVRDLFDRLLPSDDEARKESQSLWDLLKEHGFDPIQHEQIKADLQHGRIGLAQNRLPQTTEIKDARSTDVFDATSDVGHALRALGEKALREGEVAVVSLAGGAGSRWTRGAGVVKALNPFCKFAGKYRSFLEVHLAKSRRSGRLSGTAIPHVITTSYLTHEPTVAYLEQEQNFRYEGPLFLSPGRSIGLRLVPTVRDLRFAWEQMPQQALDEQKEKVRDSVRAALIMWAQKSGEGSDYTDNLPTQCLHPTGHWYEVPNLLRNGVLLELIRLRPQLKHLLVHNIDTVGINVDAGLLGLHVQQGAAMTVEIIGRQVDDHGGGLARVNGQLRLVEGLALPNEEAESLLSFYNTNSFWIDIDQLLAVFALTRQDLSNEDKVTLALRNVAGRMPSYITLKDVKKRWGKGQEDIFPLAQFEKLFVDMTGLDELRCAYAVVPRARGQQLKEPAQLDAWLQDGSAAYVDSLADWN